MNLQMVTQDLYKRVEEYYEQLLTLANSLQHLANDQLLIIFLRLVNCLAFKWILSIWNKVNSTFGINYDL
jgi:hypothetical protein